VPTIALQEQWAKILRYRLLYSPKTLGFLGGRSSNFDHGHQVVIAVLDSARIRLADIARHWNEQGHRVLLIVDECHRLGSAQTREMLNLEAEKTLGLSATPQLGGGFEEQIERALGPVIYELPLLRALDEGMLAPLRLLNIYFDLRPAEHNEFRKTAELCASLRSSLSLQYPELREESSNAMSLLQAIASEDPRAKQLLRLLQQNRRLVANSSVRKELLIGLIDHGIFSNSRTIVFNETIHQAETAFFLLKERGLNPVIDHSKVPSRERSKALSQFGNGSNSTLVAVRTVDEGIDVPDANRAIIVSGTLTKRQRVQRIGRVVRPSGGTATVISLLARGTTEEYVVGMEDPALVGPSRVRTCIGAPSIDLIEWALGHDL
jgi:superfamily II DNA or RNA helicase